MDDLDFLPGTASGDNTATLMVLLPDASVAHIRNVSPFRVLDKCPLLYHAFEFGAHSIRQANIEATSKTAVVSLLRFLYTTDYLPSNPADGQYPLLAHAETYKIAEDFDVPELQVAAYVNLMRETEFSCSLPAPPSDLCETIRFVYEHLVTQQSDQHQNILDTLLNYCLSTFKYQGLGEHAGFRQVVFETPQFHRDLCRTSMKRDFEDEGALEIVRLPVCKPTPYSREDLDKRALGDFQFEFWQDTAQGISSPGIGPSSPTGLKSPTTTPSFRSGSNSPKKEPKAAPLSPTGTINPNVATNLASGLQSPKRRRSDVDGTFVVVSRPKDPKEMPAFSETDEETSADEDTFTLVHRPKLSIDTTQAAPLPATDTDTPSSAELVSASDSLVITEPESKKPVPSELETKDRETKSSIDLGEPIEEGWSPI